MAIKNVKGGDTIQLAAGTYDKLELNANKSGYGHLKFGQKVTITSADPGNPAIINQMSLRGAAMVEVKNVKLDYSPSKSDSTPFEIDGARNVTLTGVKIEGHLSGGLGDGVGLMIKNSEDVTLANSEISNFRNGLNAANSSDVTISGNDLRGISNDAMILSGMDGVRIADNDFRAMKSSPSLKHKDMIQFHNSSGENSRDIEIRGNVIDNPEQTHAIYFGNFLAREGDQSAYFRNVVIADNDIRSAQVHGITIDHGHTVTIENNTLIPNDDLGLDAMINIPLINVSKSSLNVKILDNEVESVPDARPTWVVSGNDTGTKNVVHWEPNHSFSGWSALSATTAMVATEAAAATVIGGQDEVAENVFRVNGRLVEGETSFLVEDLDFASDVLVFRRFEANTFVGESGGNQVQIWDTRGSVKIDSIADIVEFATFSPNFTATTREANDTLVLRIDQQDGVAEILLEDHGADYLAASDPDLF